MLSYRHAFHAGNHADVLKHVMLRETLSYLVKKDKALTYIDTHSGAGSYVLDEGFSAQNKEWISGIDRLRGYSEKVVPPKAVADYLAAMDEFKTRHHGESYPGSPLVAAQLLRRTDSAILCELHPKDHEALVTACSPQKNMRAYREDGFARLKASLPPPSRRALIFIDPSYELEDDFNRVVIAVRDSLQRFATGVYVIWYPLLEKPDALALPARLMDLLPDACLYAELRTQKAVPGGFGMTGSGTVVLNPPWGLERTVSELLPFLADALGADACARGISGTKR